MVVATHYGALELGGHRRMTRTKARVMYAVAAACVASVCMIAVAVSTSSPTGEQPSVLIGEGMDDMDVSYLSAEARGKDGDSLLKRLQEVWFVGAHKDGLQDVSAQANSLATQLMSAEFPPDVKAAISGKVNPCDDFYEYACGAWDAEHKDKIQEYKSSVGLSWDMANKAIRDAMTDILKVDEGPAGTFWKSCMDLDLIEKTGADVLKPWLAIVDEVKDMKSLVDATVALNKNNLDTLFSWYVDRDPTNDKQNAFFLTEAGTSLPDKTYYTEQSQEMKEHRAKLQERIGHFLGMVGREDPEGEAELVLKLETQMAEAHEDKAESRRDHGKLTTWEEVEQLVPNWPWQEWLKGLAECTAVPDGGPSACEGFHKPVVEVGREGGQPLLIRSKGFFEKLDGILKDQPLEAIKSLMRWKIIKDAAPSMSAAFLDSMVELNKDIYGTKTKSPRERKCYFSTMSTAGWPAAKIYADKVFHRGNIKAAEEMLGKIRAEFDEALAEESWMAPEDRKKAQFKLQHMFFQVGVPTDKDGKEHWPEKTGELDGKMTDSLYKNQCVANRLAVERSLNELTEVPDRRHWGGSTPLAVNAFYGPSNNGLWIPAGILQKPFFDEEMGDARNYGAIGAVLGHEMSHGFDDNGRQYDANGELHDWWSAATVKGFKKGSQCISDLFSSFSVKGRHVNGDLTLGEDIADSGGLKFSFSAFTKDGGRTSAEKRLFFTAFAQVWCQVSRRKSAVAGMLSDPHAPAKFRVIGGLSQFPAFSEAFACPLGSPMSPADKCSLW